MVKSEDIAKKFCNFYASPYNLRNPTGDQAVEVRKSKIRKFISEAKLPKLED